LTHGATIDPPGTSSSSLTCVCVRYVYERLHRPTWFPSCGGFRVGIISSGFQFQLAENSIYKADENSVPQIKFFKLIFIFKLI